MALKALAWSVFYTLYVVTKQLPQAGPLEQACPIGPPNNVKQNCVECCKLAVRANNVYVWQPDDWRKCVSSCRRPAGPQPLALPAPGGTRVFKFKIAYGYSSPDCVVMPDTPLVNGMLPGPTITVRSGEVVQVQVENRLTEAVSLHWHGLHQYGNPYQDGAAYVSQCPIPPGQSFTYRFRTDGQSGTFWWHAHSNMARASVYGALTILPARGSKEPFAAPAREFSLLLGDWYHSKATDLLARIEAKRPNYRPMGMPASILINGRTLGNCGAYKQREPTNPRTCKQSACATPAVHHVRSNSVERMRVCNTALMANIHFQIMEHPITIVEADGSFVKGQTYEWIEIFPGECYTALVNFNRPPKNYWIIARGIYETTGTLDGLAIIRYPGARMEMPRDAPSIARRFANLPVYSAVNEVKWRAQWPDYPRRMAVTKKLYLRWGENENTDGTVRYSVNDVSFKLPTTVPLLVADALNMKGVFSIGDTPGIPGMPRMGRPPVPIRTSVIDIPINSFVEIIFQNFNPPGNQHPWHLHGHSFWVVGSGTGDFNARKWATYQAGYNTFDPQRRNVITVVNNQWIAVRVFMNNPGMWPLHCHLEQHNHLGMQVILRVKSPYLGGPPSTFLQKCPIPKSSPKPSTAVPSSPPMTMDPGGTLVVDWSDQMGGTVKIPPGTKIKFSFGKSDGAYHSLMAMYGPPATDAMYAAANALLKALPDKRGVDFFTGAPSRLGYGSTRNIVGPGLMKEVLFKAAGKYAFTCSAHYSSMVTIVDIAAGYPKPSNKPTPVPVAPKPRPPRPRPPRNEGPPPSTGSGKCFAVTTNLFSNSRQGVNYQEMTLTPSNVKGGSFGRLRMLRVDGLVYAQPLFVPQVSVASGPCAGKPRNMVFVATLANNVYGFDADTGTQCWQRSLGSPRPPMGGCGDIQPHVGILATPVIDLGSRLLYVLANTWEGGRSVFRLVGLSLGTGDLSKNSGPIGASFKGHDFDATLALSRVALTLHKGVIYSAYSSHCDSGKYRGWVLGHAADSLRLVYAWSPESTDVGGKPGGGIWQSGSGLTVSGSGNALYVVTGNGAMDAGAGNYGSSAVKLSLGSPSVLSFFTPGNWRFQNDEDLDFGSGGATLIDDLDGGEGIITMGKYPKLFLLSGNNLGGAGPNCGGADCTDPHAKQGLMKVKGRYSGNGPYWKSDAGNFFYIHQDKGNVFQHKIAGGRLDTNPRRSNVGDQRSCNKCGQPVVSSSGRSSATGIVWEIVHGGVGSPATLWAYRATDLSPLWSSNMFGGDEAGKSVKFTVPTVTCGKVFVGGDGMVTVYGLI